MTSHVNSDGAFRLNFARILGSSCKMSAFHGRIHGLENILVDNFLSYKSHTCFFLSHCHSDHMFGIDQLFLALSNTSNQYLYCSPISRLILLNKFNNASEDFIKELTSSQVITVPENAAAPSYKVTVTSIPAGHCPGSIMFLFETVNTCILYTGDFRILKDDVAKFKCLHSKSLVKSIDKLYFDSTFLSEIFWEFPSRSESVSQLLELVMNWTTKSPGHNVLLETSAQCGYEYVFVELGRKLKCKIHVKDSLHDVYWNVPEVGCFLTKDCGSTKIHAMATFDRRCVSFNYENLLRIKLSALWYKSVRGCKRDKIWEEDSKGNLRLCYSNHCSCSELVDFLNHLQPNTLEPFCVAVGTTKEGTKSYADHLMLKWSRKRRKSPEPEKSDFPLEKNYKFRIRFPQVEKKANADEIEIS